MAFIVGLIIGIKSTEQTFINKNNIVGPGTYNTPEEAVMKALGVE